MILSHIVSYCKHKLTPMYVLAGRVGEEGIMVGGAGALVSGGRGIGRQRGGGTGGRESGDRNNF